MVADWRDVPLEKRWQRPEPPSRACQRRHHREGTAEQATAHGGAPPTRREPPEQRGARHGQPHDVQDVHPQERHERVAWADDERLESEDKGQGKYLEPSPHQRTGCAGPGPGSAQPPLDRQPERQPRQPQKERRGKAAEHVQIAERQGVAVRAQRPGVKDMCLDHDQHGNAARPVNVGSSRDLDRGAFRA